VLGDYSKAPTEEFWAHFPRRDLPSKQKTSIDTDLLEEMIVN
jgi:hypothetical protein